MTFDIDGDQDLDILGVAAFGFFFTSNLLRNDGAGQFVDVTATHMPAGAAAEAAALPIDIDNDGDLDLFFVGTQHPSVVLKNNGLGVFSVHATLPTVTSSVGGAVADFDGDGDQDVVLAGTALLSGQDQVLSNDGTGTFTATTYFNTFFTSGIVATDVDADLDIDIVQSGAGGLRLLRNDGAMTFTDISATHVSLPPIQFLGELVGGDFDGDGDVDLLVLGSTGSPDIIVHNQAGVLTFVGSLPANTYSQSISLGDVDMDGDLDAMRTHTGGVVSLSLNDGLGNFTDATSRMPPHTIYSKHVLLADLDGDDDADLLTCYGGLAANIIENRHLQLEAMPAVIGQMWQVTAYSEPGYASQDHAVRLAIGSALLPQALPIPGLGSLWLNTGTPLLLVDNAIAASAGRHTFPFLIPNAPQFLGIQLHVQAIVDQAPAPERLTTYDTVTIQ